MSVLVVVVVNGLLIGNPHWDPLILQCSLFEHYHCCGWQGQPYGDK